MNRYKKYTVAPRFLHLGSGDAMQNEHTDLQQDSSLAEAESKGKWLPIFAVSIYFISLWKPPIVGTLPLRWYFVLGLALFAFMALRKPLNGQAAKVFWITYGLGLFGAILSLFRAIDLDQALWNTVGMGVSFISYLLFLPVLSLRKTRQFFLVLLVGIGILWAIEIQRLSAQYGTLHLGTFGKTGQDKNAIGFCLCLATIVLFYLNVFWRGSGTKHKGMFFMARLGLGLISIFLIYSMVIIYARSAVLATTLGICAVLGVMLIKNPGRLGRSRAVMIGIILAASVMFLLPKVLSVSPEWNRLSNYEDEGLGVINTYEIRTVLINKGLFLVKENPFIGVGIGGTKFAVITSQYYFPDFWIHNTFLTDWAEKGILGLFSNMVWIFAYLKMLRKKFFNLHVIDQVWLILFIPLFFDMNFLDMNTIGFFMLAILTGIAMEHSQLDQLKQPLHDIGAGRLMSQGRT